MFFAAFHLFCLFWFAFFFSQLYFSKILLLIYSFRLVSGLEEAHIIGPKASIWASSPEKYF